jgi:hypothetical protein
MGPEAAPAGRPAATAHGHSHATKARHAEAEEREEAEEWAAEAGEVTNDSPFQLLLQSLDAAFRSLGYTDPNILQVVSSKDFPPGVIAYVANGMSMPTPEVKQALVAQCPAIEQRVRSNLAEAEREKERRRRAQREIEAAGEAEKAKLIEAEKERQRKRLLVYICGVCGRRGCPVMPLPYEYSEGEAVPTGKIVGRVGL